MIEVQDIVADADMISPEPWTILRSVATFGWGGVQTSITSIPATGPVRVASNREIQMLPEADRVGSIRAFYYTAPLYVTRGTQPVPVAHNETPDGAIPGTVYTLSTTPPGDSLQLTKNQDILIPGVDYTISGNTLTLTVPTVLNDVLSASWIVTGQQSGLSDQISYRNETFRLLQVYRTQGSGYWKALATRENPS
jgi:hypothetical protein